MGLIIFFILLIISFIFMALNLNKIKEQNVLYLILSFPGILLFTLISLIVRAYFLILNLYKNDEY